VALVFGLVGGLIGLGVLIAATAWWPPPPGRVAARRDWRQMARPIAAGAIAGVVALVFTGWIAAGLGGAWAGYAAMQALSTRRTSAKVEQERITALASWCEQLRDLLTAEHGIIGTIGATARTCPEPIRPEVERLATRLSRQHPSTAIRQFAAELDDPSGDLVASVLLLATTHSSRTSELLSELAGTIRDRAAMRLRVEADRAGQRSEARFILAFSAASVLGVLVFGRDSEFLDAYDSLEGQLVFAIVVAMFVVGGVWMARLTRFERPARFLSISEER
jgi:Flp pilus assembly protein TadB